MGLSSSCTKTIPVSNGHNNGGIPQIVETKSPVLTPKPVKVSSQILGYYEALPVHYQETTQRYPVIIFLHGGGQYGNGNSDLDTLLTESIPKLIKENKFPGSFTVSSGIYSFIVIIPQLLEAVVPQQLDALVEFTKLNYRVDTSRIYIAGMSLGARQAIDYCAFSPLKVAAVVAMAGMPTVSTMDAKSKIFASSPLPLWQVHNKDDSAWSFNESQIFIDKINALSPGIPPRFSVFETGVARLHHDSWTKVSDPSYIENGKNIYEWMLGYSR